MSIKVLTGLAIASTLASGSPCIAATKSPFVGQCANIPVTPSRIIKKAVFQVNLKPYGDVCFVAHNTSANGVTETSSGQNYYIALSLYQNGKHLYDFTKPNTPSVDWPDALDDITSVAFRKLKGTPYTDVLVIGRGSAANGNDLYYNLVYTTTASGFVFEQKLVESDAIADIDNMSELIETVNRVGVNHSNN